MKHRMAWVEKDHKGHLVSTPLLCAGSPTTRPGCPVTSSLALNTSREGASTTSLGNLFLAELYAMHHFYT